MSMKTILNSSEETKPLRICSIDASTNNLAFAIFNNKELISTGKIKFAGKNSYEKVVDACKKLNAFFKMYNIVDAIVIEHTVFMNSPKVAADLALVQGAILGAAGINNIKIAGSVSPITWQIYIGNPKLTVAEKKELEAEYPGKTKAWYQNRSRDIRKIRTIQFVNTYYDKEIDDNDVADAVGIGHWAINNWGKLTK
jgi:Holliday junction resolvasome RuvABC endonuclease subunit